MDVLLKQRKSSFWTIFLNQVILSPVLDKALKEVPLIAPKKAALFWINFSLFVNVLCAWSKILSLKSS